MPHIIRESPLLTSYDRKGRLPKYQALKIGYIHRSAVFSAICQFRTTHCLLGKVHGRSHRGGGNRFTRSRP